jgi:formate dehydrogenase subunit gamma
MSELLTRFTRRQRLEHVLVMASFTLLAVTGFPQKFYDASWAHATVAAFGGVDRLRFVHRACGILFAALAVMHVALVSIEIAIGRSRPTLVPTRRDFADAMQTLRYYLGLAERQAAFDRFDYRQKFEYWGLLLGGVVMIVTGFILLYPLTALRWLPGELVPASKVAHSNEGLMAFLVVITWHIYNAHLSPDVFPFDTSIFTGRISRERMSHEHPIELERIENSRAAPVTVAEDGDGPHS